MLCTIVTCRVTYSKYIFSYEENAFSLSIDRTPPVATIYYSEIVPTKNNITVKIIFNEEIQDVKEWTFQDNRKTIEREYTNNIEEKIEVSDLAGNTTIVDIKINNIDRQAPVIEGVENENGYQSERKIHYSDNIQVKDAIYYYNEKNESLETFYTLEQDEILSKNGYYLIIVTDTAGNKSEKTFYIDKEKPIITIENIGNNNTGYEEYANRTHLVTAIITATDNMKCIDNFNIDNILVYVGEKEIKVNKKMIKLKEESNSIKWRLEINNISENGELYIKIKEKAFFDVVNNYNDLTICNTGINIDNVMPTGKYTQKLLDSGKVLATIDFEEPIRKINGWTLSEDSKKITKEFPSNVSYNLPVLDYAQNKGNVEVNVVNADYINLTYGSHNSEIGWSFGYGNYDIAGMEAIKVNPMYKTESLAFNLDGKVAKNFVQAQGFAYTYWGEGSIGVCDDTQEEYPYGYTTWKGMNIGHNPIIQRRAYFQFGGAGINQSHKTDINGTNPIPNEIGFEYRYGISGIKFKLQDYTEYSIIYQIYVDKIGWLKTAINEEGTMYRYDKPMSAIRVAIIPNSEVNYIIETWKK